MMMSGDTPSGSIGNMPASGKAHVKIATKLAAPKMARPAMKVSARSMGSARISRGR